jgi:hypothetical protein
MKEEPYLPFETPRGATALATHVRSTLLCSSIQALRGRKLFDKYLAALPQRQHETILMLVPGQWLPVDIAVMHYVACDALALAPQEIEAIGAEVAQRIHHSFIGVVVKVSREGGMSPWTLFSNSKRLRDLSWRGSDVAVTKLGPKEARFEWAGIPCAQSRYYRSSFAGFLRAHTELFCQKAYAVPLSGFCTERALGYRVSWV